MSINRRRILREYYDRDVTELNSLLELVSVGELKLTDRYDDLESGTYDWNSVSNQIDRLKGRISRFEESYPWILTSKV